MAALTKIAWADSTLNYWIGCTKISGACDGCYAEALMDHRRHRVNWGPHGDRSRTKTWHDAYRWQRQAAAFRAEHGRNRRVFVNSLSDTFDNHRSIEPEWREAIWQAARDCPDIDFLILTKRPQNFARYLPADWGAGYPNVWLGVTTEDQDEFDRRVPILIRTPARVRWLSIEPYIGGIHPLWLEYLMPGMIHWAIIGGESGPAARPMLGITALLADLAGLRVGRFVKQMSQFDWGNKFADFERFPKEWQIREDPKGVEEWAAN